VERCRGRRAPLRNLTGGPIASIHRSVPSTQRPDGLESTVFPARETGSLTTIVGFGYWLEYLMLSETAMNVLRTTSLFAGFNDEQLEMVPKVGRERTFEPGEKIVEEGATGARSLWLVLDGEVDIVVAGKVLRSQGPGSHFGELALLTEAPRSADVVARTTTVALELSRSHLHGLIGSNPQAAIDMLAELATRLRHVTEVLAKMTESESAEAAKPDAHHLGAIEYALDRLEID